MNIADVNALLRDIEDDIARNLLNLCEEADVSRFDVLTVIRDGDASNKVAAIKRLRDLHYYPEAALEVVKSARSFGLTVTRIDDITGQEIPKLELGMAKAIVELGFALKALNAIGLI